MKKLTSTFILSLALLFSVFAIGCAGTATKPETQKPTETTSGDKTPKPETNSGKPVSSGSFVGKSKHVTAGSATIRKSSEGYVLELGDDFDFDGAPDPKFAFGKNGVNKETIFSALKENKGAQSYEIPDSINPQEFNEIWLWCKKFDVPLGVAKLSK